jgi:hypothetical protein
MASIFENSYLTVAATAAANNEAGCFWNVDGFHGRRLGDEDTVPLELRHLSVRKKMQHWERIWTSNREARFPLLTRAWVFQERILAPRVLHFSHHELVWECAECGDCQCGDFDGRSNAKIDGWKVNNSWRAAVELYTSLELSRETDRLAALRGFAEFYARIVLAKVEEDWHAGLWKDTLHLDLLWRIESLDHVDMDARRLCRCWDTEFATLHRSTSLISEKTDVEKQFSRTCQYSCSSACSTKCLESRRLCRYGTQSGAVSLAADIKGISCVDWHQEETSIGQLLSHDERHPLLHLSEPSNFPSWSWASASRSVKY